MTKKKPYFFTSWLRSSGEQETVWVDYLAICECKDVRPGYVFALAIMQNAVP